MVFLRVQMEFFHAVCCVTQRICSILHYEGKVHCSYYKAPSQSPMGADHILFNLGINLINGSGIPYIKFPMSSFLHYL